MRNLFFLLFLHNFFARTAILPLKERPDVSGDDGTGEMSLTLSSPPLRDIHPRTPPPTGFNFRESAAPPPHPQAVVGVIFTSLFERLVRDSGRAFASCKRGRQ
jgi:hypothetical protein